MISNFVQDILHNTNKPTTIVQYARVVEIVNDQPVLRFVGEDCNSAKAYRSLKSYLPSIGDRVIVINDLIVGGWN